jgi:hypothetical protein
MTFILDVRGPIKFNRRKRGNIMSKTDIERIRSWNVNDEVTVTEKFVSKYTEIKELNNDEAQKEINGWLKENTVNSQYNEVGV